MPISDGDIVVTNGDVPTGCSTSIGQPLPPLSTLLLLMDEVSPICCISQLVVVEAEESTVTTKSLKNCLKRKAQYTKQSENYITYT